MAAVPAWAQSPGEASGEKPPAAAPGESALPRIRSIRIEIDEIFEGENLASVYRTVNSLKMNTREEVVRRELLFHVGDIFDQFLIDESQRNIRALPFLRRVKITPTQAGNDVDIVVAVQDEWTLIPQGSFAFGGGRDSTSIGITESNLLGYGKRVELFVANDEGRNTIEGVYDDRRLFGTYQRLLLGQFVRSDGYRSVALYGRPFRSLVDRDAWQVFADSYDLVGKLYENGDERFIFRERHEEFDGRYTVAAGDPEDSLYRVSLGYTYLLEQFKEADEGDFEDADVDFDDVIHDPDMVADDRRMSGPYLQLDQVSPDYISINYIDRFDRTEDFNLGNELSFRTWVALDVLGSEEDILNLGVSERHGFRFGDKSFLRGEIGAGSRLYDEGFTNTIVFGEAKFYDVLGAVKVWDVPLGIHTIASVFRLDYSVDLDKDKEFLVGGENFIRGYERRTFTGDKRVGAVLEDRFVIAEDIFRVLSVGGVLFAGAGGATDDSFADLFKNEIYSDIGIGLRLGFPRFGGGVVRLDLAFPLREDPEGRSAWEPRLVVTTGQLFNARLPAESLGPERTNVTVGLGD